MGEYKLKKNPIARVDLDGNITEIKETRKKPVARVDLSGKITDVEQPKKKKKGNFVQRGLSTAGDALISAGEGFLRTTENWADYISYKAADVADYFGWVSDEYADEWRDAIKKDIIGDTFDNKAFNAVKDESYMNQTARSVFEGTGNVLAMIGGGEVLGVSSEASSLSNAVRTGVASFTNGYGSSMSEALRNGADYKTAKKAAIINGTAEAISEQVFNGIPGMKVENWGGKLTGKIGSQVERYFGTKAGKLALKALDASGEGLEEIISNVLVSTGNDIAHWLNKNYTYGMENQTGNVLKDAWSSATSKESWNSFLSASLTSALVGGGNTILSNVQKNNIIKAYAEDNNMSVKEVKDMFKQSAQETADYLQKQQSKMNLGERVETEQRARDITLKQMKDNTFVKPGTETDAYQYQETDNEKVNNVRKSLAELNVNNTIETREMARTAERLARDLGIDIEFTNNEKLQSQMSEEQKKETQGRVVNGFVDKNTGKMYLNVDGDQIANFTIGHETKHFFEANKELNTVLNKALKEYAQLKGRYDEDLARITKTYTDKNGNLIADPETELMADYVGEFFTDYNFVSNLSTKNPSLFARARDFFQKLYYKATGQQEKLLLKQINDNINKAYREYAKNKPDTNISSNEIQKVSQKEETKQEIKEKVEPKEENVLPIAEKVEEKQEVAKKQEKKVEVKEKPQVKQENRLTQEENDELRGLQAAEEAFGNEGEDKVRYDYLMDKKNGNLKYPSLKTETTYQDIKNKYTKYKNNMEGFNSDLIQQAKDFVPGYRNTERRTKQQWLDVAEMIGKRSNFKTDAELEKYAIQSWFKEQPNQKGNLNRQGEKFVKFTIEDWINSVYKGAGVGERIDNSIKYSLSQELDDYLDKNKFTLDVNGNMSFENLTSKQITALASIYRKTGYSDVSSEYLKNKLSTFNGLKVPREVADRFIQQELGYKPKIDTTKVYEDAEGNPLTKEQVEFYKDSDVRDIRGRLIPVYHKTNAEFTVFDKKAGKQHGNKYGKGFYFSITPENYGNNEMKVYLNAKEGEYKYIPSQGYYVVQEANQIKNVDNTNPTDSPDIRYSLSEDNQGRELSEQQQEYFKDSKVVDEDGNLKVMYHGTPNTNFTIFENNRANSGAGLKGLTNKGFYFTDTKLGAEQYAIPRGERGIGETPGVKEVYLNITNPLVVDSVSKEGIKQIKDFFGIKGNKKITFNNIDNYVNKMLYDDAYNLRSEEQRQAYFNSTGYDGVILKGQYGDEYVVFNPNQIKNVDNTNPTEDSDIRYSLSQKEDTDFDELSEKQIEYFKNTKAVDKHGYLETVYHGTPEDFNIFDIEKAGKTGVEFGNGFYFTNSKGTAMAFTEGGLYGDSYDQVKEGYINIEKPASRNSKTISFDEFKKLYNELNNNKNLYDEEMGMSNIDALLSDYGDIYNDKENTIKKFYDSYDNDVTLIDNLSYMTNPKEMYLTLRNVTGIDGIIIENPTNYDSYEKYYVAFNPDQFKLKSNKNPSESNDMRYLLSREGEDLESYYQDLYPIKNKATTRLSDLKRREVELPIEEEKPLKLSKNEQKQVNNMNNEYLPLAVDKDVLKVEAADIANEINTTGDFDTTKKRGWIESLKSSDAIEDKSILNNLDFGKLNYQVQSNQKSLNKANDYIEKNGYENSLNHVKDLIRSEKTPSAADVALMQRMTQEAIKNKDYQAAQELIMDTAILGTDLGQAVQALSIIQRLTPEGQLKLYTKIVNRAKIRGEKAFRDVQITPDMVETVLGAYNEDGTYDQNDLNSRVAQFKQNIAEQMKSTIGDKANAWRYLSMLGNPKTHIRNVISNVAMGWTTKVKNAMARTFETILPVKERTKTFVPASKEIRNFAKDTAIDMKGIITGENKYNEKVALEQEKQIFKNKVLEGVSRFNSAALEAEDWFFSRHAFEQNFREFLTARGIKTMEDVENNPDIVQQGKTYAVEQAEIATFRQYSKLASEISRIERNGKATKLAIAAVLPFKKTPINVAKAGLKYSPLGLIKNVSYDAYQLSKGNINASQFIDNLSQGLTGTSIALVGYALAKAGILTGGSDDDKEDKYDSQLGKQNYAINIGGKSYSISWLSPTAMPLLVGANAYEKLEEEKDWSADILIDTLAKTLDPLSEMSFVSSLTDTLKSYNSGGVGMIKDMGETAAQSYVLQFFPTLFGQMASTLDDTKRSTKASNNTGFKFGEETVRKIMLKIPGLRNQLEPQTDIWGNEKEQSGNIITRAVESFIAPYSKTEDITSDIDRELKRVYNQTGETGVIPGIPQAYVKKDDETYRMSASEYTQYKKTFGQIANQTMNELFNSDSYQDVSDEDKSKMIENVYKYAREQAKQEYFNNINEDFETKKSDKIDRVMEEYDITAGDYYANMEEFNYADKNPDRYLAIKQIADYKDYAGYKEEINYIKNTYSDKNERKRAVYEYINGLPLSVEQKIILQKVGANYSIKQYRGRLQSYINSLDLTRDEKIAIDKVLFK